jgi:hypothetical protein
MSRLHSMAILAMSLVVFTLSLGVAAFGTSRESLYAEPAHHETAAPDKPACCH